LGTLIGNLAPGNTMSRS